MSNPQLVYPYPLNLRWNYLEWFPVYFKRLHVSSFMLKADLDVRGAAFGVMTSAMYSRPPATFPIDPFIQAHHLRISLERWQELMRRDITPLEGWEEILCGRETRLTHPVLLEGLEVAVKAAKLRQRGTTDRRRGDPPDAGRAPAR